MPDTKADSRTALLNLIATLSFKLGDFTLASGKKSDYYIDCRITTLHAEGGPPSRPALHHEIIDLSRPLELGEEDPGLTPTLIHGFLVRKSEKSHGTGRKIEGFLQPGARVVIVDDVCTTGGSTITAIEAAREAGMTVAGVLCLVDREQGGREKIEAASQR